MIVSNTCVSGNDTFTCVESGSPVGLAVGLTLFFLLLVIIAGIIVYKYYGKTRMLMQLRQSRSQKNEDFTETPQAAPHQYTSMSREQSTGQIPIYENLTAQTAKYRDRHAVNQSRVSSEPEEDLYLQYDSPDEAIYNNDPTCNLSILDFQEEDVYIVPDS